MSDSGSSPGDSVAPLIVAVATGDRSAFERLYATTSPRLYGLILRIVRRRDWADEILQDVFLSVWKRAASFEPGQGEGYPWLVTIARNRAIDVRRVHAGAAADETLTDDYRDESASAGIEASAAEERRLHRCLEQLSADQRRAIELAYVAGCTHSEIANETDHPIGTIKSWIRRGLAALYECFN